MNDFNNEGKDFLTFKIIQSGESIKVQLTTSNLNKSFLYVLQSLLKDLKLKQKNIFLSNEEGKMVGINDFRLSLKEIIHKFGTILKVYSEKIF
ncbi:MAG: hypothetical protein ACFFDY_04025 [Candidatus Thorarchaeota archaeon]